MYQRIHILGAPGSGVTTLGKTLAGRLGFSHFDTDDYYWFTDDALPYRRKRNVEHRCKLLREDLAANNQWVLSGALCGWGDIFAPEFDLIIYLWLPVELRLERISLRETKRYGADRLAPGGDLHPVYQKFLTWAAAYDLDSGNLRSRAGEMQWMLQRSCPLIRLEGHTTTPDVLADYVLEKISG